MENGYKVVVIGLVLGTVLAVTLAIVIPLAGNQDNSIREAFFHDCLARSTPADCTLAWDDRNNQR